VYLAASAATLQVRAEITITRLNNRMSNAPDWSQRVQDKGITGSLCG
jgi:hypothetical protein